VSNTIAIAKAAVRLKYVGYKALKIQEKQTIKHSNL
jgi:hypothetical protein